MKCAWKTCENTLSGRAKRFCSIQCKNKYWVTENRRNTKKRLVEYFGGKCQWCGYDKHVAALQFHHPNNDKEFGIGERGVSRSWARQLAEAEKCVLICANCHAEEHARLNAQWPSGKALHC